MTNGSGWAVLRQARTFVVLSVALVIGIAGYVLGSSRDRHSATAVVLKGTVTWSNQNTRLIAFDTDGVIRGPNDDDTIYNVTADNWQDVAGTFHGGDTYPSCLASEGDSEVSTDRHRVELTVIDWDTVPGHPEHFAVQVHCLD
jgi:hypothetical protein